MLLETIPLYVLYEASILLASFAARRRPIADPPARDTAPGASAAAGDPPSRACTTSSTTSTRSCPPDALRSERPRPSPHGAGDLPGPRADLPDRLRRLRGRGRRRRWWDHQQSPRRKGHRRRELSEPGQRGPEEARGATPRIRRRGPRSSTLSCTRPAKPNTSIRPTKATPPRAANCSPRWLARGTSIWNGKRTTRTPNWPRGW